MSASPTFRAPQQAPWPDTGDDERQIEESIKIERNSKGYNWSFRLKRLPGEEFATWVNRTVTLDNMLRNQYGQ